MIIPFMIFNPNKIVGGSRSLDLETTNYLSKIVKKLLFIRCTKKYSLYETINQREIKIEGHCSVKVE
jgi:hypothetical protein